MTRAISTTMATAIAEVINRPVYLVKIELNGGDLYASSSPVEISWDGQSWQALDARIGSFTQGPNGIASASIQFPGHNNPLALSVAAGNHMGKPADVYLGYVDSDGAILEDPELLISGRCGGGAVNDSGVSVNVLEGRSTRYGYAPRRWFTPDNGFHHLPKGGQVIHWKDEKIVLTRRGE